MFGNEEDFGLMRSRGEEVANEVKDGHEDAHSPTHTRAHTDVRTQITVQYSVHIFLIPLACTQGWIEH